MQKNIHPQRLALFNTVVASYFILLFIAAELEFKAPWLGFFVELLTIPFFFGQFVLLYFSMKHLKAHKNKKFFLYSTLAVLVTSIVTCISLMISFL
ncbi:hypothetical protein SAMN05216474_0614 [Lishizhenia tianjinensis]|uniref:Uncharacterized protein n=1 Tax=Lishizhenia tianjinensis TaxID=477690 RepID=A0A1I6Y2L0_9FLAO|nr:hypothetical protein [Lishizhenia tianjinensis]SFT44637.1 hypothetical protein SAMN05216474_0614 [Lishizhenia tianjinensis]